MYPSDVGPVGQWRKERIFKTEKFHIFHTIYTETCTSSILLPLSLSPIYVNIPRTHLITFTILGD